MCGICGVKGIPLDHNMIDRKNMLKSLFHRGPDSQGEYCDSEERLYLGASRLSIVDLTSFGSQPVFNEDKTIVLVCNGEIYNALSLKKELQERSHRFYSTTDIEVIVHLYEEMGELCLSKLKGMFAFALWDKRKKSLFIARDRMGIKPLYYHHANGIFAFSSELTSLMKLTCIRREIDLRALDLYFSLEYVPAPFSMYRGIFKLMPGSFLTYSRSELRMHPYWDLDQDKSQAHMLCFTSAAERLEQLLKASVREHLIADVPVGVFLSGGLDSSILVALANHVLQRKCITFSIGFDEKTFDESPYAQNVARFLGTQHHHAVFTLRNFLDIFHSVSYQMDEPFGDLSIFPTNFLSRFARYHVKTVLSGDGADELFMGYPTYKAHQFLEGFKGLPLAFSKNMLRLLAGILPVKHAYFSIDFKIKQLLRAEEVWQDPCMRHSHWMGSFLNKEKDLLYSAALRQKINSNELSNYYYGLFEKYQQMSVLKRIQYMDIYGYLSNDLLVKADRASMFASLECRVPYLDHILMEFIWNLPTEYIYQKYLLKFVFRKYLPKEVIQRKKQGFSMPFAIWLRNKKFTCLINEFTEQAFICKQGLFNPEYIRQIFKEHALSKKDHRKKIGTYIMFQMWYQKEKLSIFN